MQQNCFPNSPIFLAKSEYLIREEVKNEQLSKFCEKNQLILRESKAQKQFASTYNMNYLSNDIEKHSK